MKHLITLLFLISTSIAYSQTEVSVVAQNLLQPVGIDQGPEGTILIAEAGTGQDDGGVTAIHPLLGQVRVLTGMPSYFDTTTQEVVGPYRVQMLEGTLAAVFMSEVPGPLGSSVLIYDASTLLLGGGPLGPEDALHQIKVGEFVRSQGYEESNPFSLVHDGCDMYIVDAAANAIIKRDGLSGIMSIFATFDPVPNTAPFGPPMTDPVPTRIVQDTAGFLVSSLTGFPFNDGASNIYRIDMEGNVSIADSGYTLVTDMAMHPAGDGCYALQFANFRMDSLPPFANGSALITHTNAQGLRDTVVSGFGASPGFIVNGDGSFYVTNIFAGTASLVKPTSTGLLYPDHDNIESIKVFPNPAREGINIQYDLPVSGESHVEIFNVLGQSIYRQELGFQTAGQQNIKLDIPGIKGVGQMYYLMLRSGDTWYKSSFTSY